MEIRVAGGADMNHCGHVELDHFLVERIPKFIGKRWSSPVASRWIRIEIASDETQLIDTPLELRNRIRNRNALRLRKLAYTDKFLRIQLAYAIDQIVAMLRPVAARCLVSDMVSHPRRARRKNREVTAALSLKFQLRAFKAFANLVIGDLESALGRHVRWIL